MLDTTVLLPPSWSAARELALTREGDTPRGSFTGIPAEARALTVQTVPVGLIVGQGANATACWRASKAVRRADLAAPPPMTA